MAMAWAAPASGRVAVPVKLIQVAPGEAQAYPGSLTRRRGGCVAAAPAPWRCPQGPRGQGHVAAACLGSMVTGFFSGLVGKQRVALRKKGKKDITDMIQLGGSPADKALAVNLDSDFYGSFAEIGAGQEVSRTFLTSGAAAGTVARSISAYDMQMSDATYGKCARYVTEERLLQMLEKEYEVTEMLRKVKGKKTRFFSFASTLAAKAFKSNRECEGWVGLMYQAAAGEKPSTVVLHVRMADPTAQLQGGAIGALGTNLIYLCWGLSNPYLITRFLLDGLEPGRLEVDYASFSGPAFPEGSIDPGLLAVRMVQFGLAPAVLLQPGAGGEYGQAVPNNAFYKRPLVVQKSRFRPVTRSHNEVMQAATKQLAAENPDARPPVQIMSLQMDEGLAPEELMNSVTALEGMRKLKIADANKDGKLTLEELQECASGTPGQEVVDLVKQVDLGNSGVIAIDELLGAAGDGVVLEYVQSRLRMLETLRYPVLISGIKTEYGLADYIQRYTNQPIVLAVGGGSYNVNKGLFKDAYDDLPGGVLEAFGRLFTQNVRILEFPNVSFTDGGVTPAAEDVVPYPLDGLYRYLCSVEKIVPIRVEHISPEVMQPKTNTPYRGDSAKVMSLISEGNSASESWRNYVSPEVAQILTDSKYLPIGGASGKTDPLVAAQKITQITV